MRPPRSRLANFRSCFGFCLKYVSTYWYFELSSSWAIHYQINDIKGNPVRVLANEFKYFNIQICVVSRLVWDLCNVTLRLIKTAQLFVYLLWTTLAQITSSDGTRSSHLFSSTRLNQETGASEWGAPLAPPHPALPSPELLSVSLKIVDSQWE